MKTFHGAKSRCSTTSGSGPMAASRCLACCYLRRVQDFAKRFDELRQRALGQRMRRTEGETCRATVREPDEPVGRLPGHRSKVIRCEDAGNRPPDNHALPERQHARMPAAEQNPWQDAQLRCSGRERFQRAHFVVQRRDTSFGADHLDGNARARFRLGKDETNDLVAAVRARRQEQPRQILVRGVQFALAPALANGAEHLVMEIECWFGRLQRVSCCWRGLARRRTDGDAVSARHEKPQGTSSELWKWRPVCHPRGEMLARVPPRPGRSSGTQLTE